MKYIKQVEYSKEVKYSKQVEYIKLVRCIKQVECSKQVTLLGNVSTVSFLYWGHYSSPYITYLPACSGFVADQKERGLWGRE